MFTLAKKSLPSRGAWIEIQISNKSVLELYGRSPRGGRGLKWLLLHRRRMGRASLPSRGAWIEIALALSPRIWLPSLPSRGAWIEIKCCGHYQG